MSRIIVAVAQRKVRGTWQDMDTRVFDQRENDYDFFGFLGLTLKKRVIPPISPPRGLPADYADAAAFGDALDDCSFFAIAELEAFDYDQRFEECRTWLETAPKTYVSGPRVSPGRGFERSIRDLLGPRYFDDLERLQAEGAERVIIGFA